MDTIRWIFTAWLSITVSCEPGYVTMATTQLPTANSPTTAMLTATDCSETGPNKCLNGGHCISDGAAKSQRQKTCLCPCHYYGPFCEYYGQKNDSEFICEYYGMRCYNGGKCRVRYDCRLGVCECARGYTGVNCEQKISTFVCTNQIPCQNGGLCVHSFQMSSNCHCKCGFFGQLCQYSTDPRSPVYKDWCAAEDYSCANGGTCFYNSTTCKPGCSCADEYGGHDCSILKTTTNVTPSGCGKYGCDVTNSGEDENENKSYISLYTAVGFTSSLIVTGSVIACICLREKNRRRSFSQICNNTDSASTDSGSSVHASRTSTTTMLIDNSVSPEPAATQGRCNDLHTRMIPQQVGNVFAMNPATTDQTNGPGAMQPFPPIALPPLCPPYTALPSYEEICSQPPPYTKTA